MDPHHCLPMGPRTDLQASDSPDAVGHIQVIADLIIRGAIIPAG